MKPTRTTTPLISNLIHQSPLRLDFPLIALGIAFFTLSPMSLAQLPSPTPDGGYPNQNTAEGDDALFSLTTGKFNTAIGFDALFSNTNGLANTATGAFALQSNTFGTGNTATGTEALTFNTAGSANTANGDNALRNNTFGNFNTATGVSALTSNNTGIGNTGSGLNALFSNTTGSGNIGVGFNAGFNLTTGDNNIDIGNEGVAAEANTIRIGDPNHQTIAFIAGISGVTVSNPSPVVIDPNGQLGTASADSLRGPPGPQGAGLVSGAILALVATAPPPAGFTKIGTTEIHYKNTTGHPRNLEVSLYQKN
jgi:hypothetical protein